jgi:hypothetical protein
MRPLFFPTLMLGTVLLSAARVMSTEPIEFQSRATQTELLELCTSEESSSCLPAEA